MNKLCGQNVGIVNITAGGTCNSSSPSSGITVRGEH